MPFGKPQAGDHKPFTLWSHFTTEAWLMECCWDGRPSSRFSVSAEASSVLLVWASGFLPNFIHFTIAEATVLLGTEMGFYHCPDLWLTPVLSWDFTACFLNFWKHDKCSLCHYGLLSVARLSNVAFFIQLKILCPKHEGVWILPEATVMSHSRYMGWMESSWTLQPYQWFDLRNKSEQSMTTNLWTEKTEIAWISKVIGEFHLSQIA